MPTTEAKREEFGRWGSRPGTQTAKARLSQRFDVLTPITGDGIIAPKAEGERLLAHRHLGHVQPGDLLLIESGSPACWLFLAILAQGADFCARLEVNKWLIAQEVVASGAPDQMVRVSLCARWRAWCRQHGFACDPIPLRLVRVDWPAGEGEVLAPSLFDQELFPPACFAELSQHRWPVEEDSNQLKSRLALENGSGLSAQAVRQDFYATLFTKNLAALLAHSAQPVGAAQSATRPHPYQVTMTNLLSQLKDPVVLLFTPAAVRPSLQALWQQMRQTLEPMRRGRSHPRKSSVRSHRFPSTYTRVHLNNMTNRCI